MKRLISMVDIQAGPGLRRGWAKALVALLAAAALLVALAWSVGAFPYKVNLSKTSSLRSAFPDVKVSAGGGYVAVVWADGRDGASDFGKIRLKRSPVLDKRVWFEVKPVFNPAASSGYGQSPRLAFGPVVTMAHVVWLWGSASTPTQIRYSKCDIASLMACNPSEGETIDSTTLPGSIVQPAITVDGNGIPHVAWVKNGTLQYGYRVGTNNWHIDGRSWSNSVAPTIAYARNGSNNYLHLAYVLSTTKQINYIRGSISGGATTWQDATAEEFSRGSLVDSGSPSIAAAGPDVILVWDAGIEIKPSNSQYAVAYNRSADAGDDWQLSGAEWRLVPTGGYAIVDSVKRTSNETSSYYIRRLQPDVTLEITTTAPYTIAHVVWHERVQSEEATFRQDVLYSSASFGDLVGGCSDCWLAPTNVTSATKGLASSVDSGSAAIAVGLGYVHTAYMEEVGSGWDVFYNGELDAEDAKGVYLPLILKNRN